MSQLHKVYQAAKSASNPLEKIAQAATQNAQKPKGPRKLTPQERQKIYARMLRVDHAGEFGANEIYRGQLAHTKNEKDRQLIQHMWDQEKVHLAKFEELLPKHKVRGTVLLPLWRVGAYALGASTAYMSTNAAMACTAAVEESIVAHYNAQLRELIDDLEKMDEKCPDHIELLETIKKFRDEEQEHHDTGIEHGAEKTMNYKLLKGAIQGICTTAIAVSER